MSTVANDENRNLQAEAYQIAHMYYDLGMLQPEIAKKMYLSRSKISRLLKYARESGIVQIKVNKVLDRVEQLEHAIRNIFGLEDAVIVANCDNGAEDLLENVTSFAAFYISKLLRGHYTLGITSGNSINKVIGKLNKINDCQLQVVQLMGSSTSSYLSGESHTIVNNILTMFNGTGYFLNTPLYIDDLYVKEILLRDSSVQTVFQQMKHCNMILTGIGSMESISDARNDWHGYMTSRHIDELQQKGAIGSICAQYFNINGESIPSEWNAKCMAMPLSDISASSNVIGVACGQHKIAAIAGALRGHLIDVLITDAQTATDIISINDKVSIGSLGPLL